MFIKRGDVKVLKIVNSDELTEEDKKKAEKSLKEVQDLDKSSVQKDE